MGKANTRLSELVFTIKSMYGQNLPVILTFHCVKMLKQILTCQYFGPNYFEMIKEKIVKTWIIKSRYFESSQIFLNQISEKRN